MESASDRARALLLKALRADDQELLAGLTASSDEQFLEWLAGHLGRALEVDYVLIGELWGEDWDRIRTVAAKTPGGLAPNFAYDLRGTPCANVVGQSACLYRDRVAELFPDDHLLGEMGVRSYAGIPLADVGGRPLGIVVVLDGEALSEERAAVCRDVLALWRPRVQAVLDHRRAAREISVVVEAARISGQKAFDALVSGLARAMHVRLAMVARCEDVAQERCDVLALWVDGARRSLDGYRVDGSPLSPLRTERSVHVPCDLNGAFPDHPLLAAFPAEAMAAVRLDDSEGQIIGHLALVHDRPLTGELLGSSVLEAYTARIAGELERLRADLERVDLERQLFLAQRMESLGVLAAGIAHDFNNVLAGISGNAELAARDDAGERAASLEEIRTAAQRAARLCGQMLSFAGRGETEKEVLDLQALVREVVDMASASLPKRCSVELEAAAEPLHVEADPAQLQQVALNLITNAADALGEAGGVVRVRVAREEVAPGALRGAVVGGDLPGGAYALLEVADAGHGMTPEVVARIFDPFFTTKATGHGLGLAAMVGIVRSHLGALGVETAPGRGSRFRVHLPVATPAEAAPEEAEVVEAGALDEPKLILVVDDEPTVLRVACLALSQGGFRTQAAASGVEAVARVAEGLRPDAALVDLSMPKKDGFATVQELRQQLPGLPVVISSGHSSAEVRERCAGLDLAGIVSKPFSLDALVAVVRAAVAGSA